MGQGGQLPPPPPPPENKAIGVMKAGHTFTIEPMISAGENLPGIYVT